MDGYMNTLWGKAVDFISSGWEIALMDRTGPNKKYMCICNQIS